jgi:hypothetical protein
MSGSGTGGMDHQPVEVATTHAFELVNAQPAGLDRRRQFQSKARFGETGGHAQPIRAVFTT